MKSKLIYLLFLFSMLLFFSCKGTKENAVLDDVFWNPELVNTKPKMLISNEEFIKGLNQSLTADIINTNFGSGDHIFIFEIMINEEGKFRFLQFKDHIGSNAGIKQSNFLGIEKFVDYLRTVKFNSAKKGDKNVGSIIKILLSITLDKEGKIIKPWQLTSNYPDKTLITETSNDKSVEEQAFTFVEQMPEYIGGTDALLKFISKNIKYPETAKSNGVEGKVMVQFIVNEKGKIIEPKILKGIGFGCDEEALRVVNILKDWKPGKQKGKPVKVKMVIPFNFRLN